MDLLKDLYTNVISMDEANDIYESIRGDIDNGVYDSLLNNDKTIDLAFLLRMDEQEYTALCQGAPFSIIARQRYEGWPCKCCKTNQFIDYKQYYWLVQELDNGDYGLLKL